MKLGIIGYGKIVKEFLPYLKKIEDIEILAVLGKTDKMEQVKALCEMYQVPNAVGNFDELISLGVDTVYIALPNHLHYQYARKALLSGLHVILEKPMTSNIEEGTELAGFAKEQQLCLFEAITTRYLASYKKISEWLPMIGSVKLVQCSYSQYSSRYDAFLRGEIQAVFDPQKSGGALMDLNLYNLHYIMGLFGEPNEAFYIANVDRGIDTSGVVIMKYDGFVGLCIAAKDCSGESGCIIQGTKGMIKSTLPPNHVGKVILTLNDGSTKSYEDLEPQARMLPEFNAFCRMIDNHDLDECYRILEESLAVNKLQTAVRLKAGIYFEADSRYLQK